MLTPRSRIQPKVIFFDAAGTLIHTAESVGALYARAAEAYGLQFSANELDASFRLAWKCLPKPEWRPGPPSQDQDRDWWRKIVELTFSELGGRVTDALFEELYEAYASHRAWRLYGEVRPALTSLQKNQRLWILSNFDRRLISVLEGLEIMDFFEGMTLSADCGAWKPHRHIFQTALNDAGVTADEALHVGDEPEADIAGAQACGLSAYLVQRPAQGLDSLARMLTEAYHPPHLPAGQVSLH